MYSKHCPRRAEDFGSQSHTMYGFWKQNLKKGSTWTLWVGGVSPFSDPKAPLPGNRLAWTRWLRRKQAPLALIAVDQGCCRGGEVCDSVQGPADLLLKGLLISYLDPKKYVRYWPYGPFFSVLHYYLHLLLGWQGIVTLNSQEQEQGAQIYQEQIHSGA